MPKNWCFTINNPSTDNIFRSTTQIKFACAILEMGEEMGTLHYQGYLELTSSRNLSQTRNLFTDTGVHLEIRMGTRAQAILYVLKTCKEDFLSSTEYVNGSGWKEYLGHLLIPTWFVSELTPCIVVGFAGTLAELVELSKEKQTTKKRLESARTMLMSGSNLLKVANEDFELFCKYGRSFQQYALLCSKPRDFKTEVIVIQGPTGTGKTLLAKEMCITEVYWKPNNIWWDGYLGHDNVILDEFYGWLQWSVILQLFDRYPLMIECKGGSINFNSKRIIVTTNKTPKQWYPNQYFPALARRVDKWIIKPELNIDTQTTWSSYEEAEPHFINI